MGKKVSRLFVDFSTYENADKGIKAWKKKVDNTKIVKQYKTDTCHIKRKEKRKMKDSLSDYIQRMLTAKNS